MNNDMHKKMMEDPEFRQAVIEAIEKATENIDPMSPPEEFEFDYKGEHYKFRARPMVLSGKIKSDVDLTRGQKKYIKLQALTALTFIIGIQIALFLLMGSPDPATGWFGVFMNAVWWFIIVRYNLLRFAMHSLVVIFSPLGPKRSST